MEKILMPTTKGKNKKSDKKPVTAQKGQRKATTDLSKDPVIIQRRKQAVAFMKKAGLPESFITKEK
jgi:hypothetical protein